MSAARLSLHDYRALADFRYQLRRFLSFSNEAARAAGLEPRQHQLLLAVKGMPEGVEATVGTIAERLQTQHHSTVELVDRAELAGLVRRTPDARDARLVRVRLTAKGERILNELTPAHLVELHSLSAVLDELVAEVTP